MLKGTVIYVLSLLILIYVNSSYSLDTMIGYLIFTVIMYAVAIGALNSNCWCTVDLNLNHLI